MATNDINLLDPKVLHAAGVPLEEALWITKVPSTLKTVALTRSKTRGQPILNRLRVYCGGSTAMAPVPA